MVAVRDAEQHHEVADVTSSKRPKVLVRST
jgi:hypothetical protein